MRPAEAEKLLGGYATGTLTEAERQHLFASALAHQAVFDALMDEEALRELLADPAVKAQLILALAHSAPPNAVPFWRRTGVLGAAASLLVAATAGLVYLRSPDTRPSVPSQEAAKAPAAKAVEPPQVQAPAPAPAGATATAPAPKQKLQTPSLNETVVPLRAPAATATGAPAQAAPPLTAQGSAAPPAPVMEDSARMKVQADQRRAEAREQQAKKAEANRPAASAVVEVLARQKDDASERKQVAPERSAEGAPGGLVGSVVGGVVGGVAQPAPVASSRKSKADDQIGALAATGAAAPTWRLDAKAEGGTSVNVMARRDAHIILLKRERSRIVVLTLQPQLTAPGDIIPWRGELRLVPGDVLDLYVLNHPVADPSHLPETGPVDGFRARIHPPIK